MDDEEQEEERKDGRTAARGRARPVAAESVRGRKQGGKARAPRAVDEDSSDAEAEWEPVSLQDAQESSRPSRARAAESEQDDDIEDFAVDDDDFV